MLTLDRLAFLMLWIKRSGLSEGNARIQWAEMDEEERREVYALAQQELRICCDQWICDCDTRLRENRAPS